MIKNIFLMSHCKIKFSNHSSIQRGPYELKLKASKQLKEREDVHDKVAIGFGIWLMERVVRDSFKPITERSKERPVQHRNTFDTGMEIVLNVTECIKVALPLFPLKV